MHALVPRLSQLEEFLCGPPQVLLPRIRAAALRRLLQDWASRGRDGHPPGHLPGRADFPPESLRYILGNLILWQTGADPRTATCRLFGANLVFERGFDLTGRAVTDHPQPAIGELTAFGLERIVAERLPVLTRGRYPGPDNTVAEIETVCLPLAADGQSIDMVLQGQINRSLRPGDSATPPTRLDTACDEPAILLPRIGDARLARLLRDWDGWRGRRRLPSRDSFRPEDLRYILGSLFLFDIEPGTPDWPAPRFRYRVFGSAVAESRGFDLTGRRIDEHPDIAFAARAQQAYAAAASARRPLWALADGVSPDGLVARFEALILPLARDGETPDMMLAAQVMAGPVS